MQGRIPTFVNFLPALQSKGADLAQRIADAVRPHAPVNSAPEPSRPPGTARDSITGKATPTANGLTVTATSDDPVMAFILHGTRAHEIVPNRAHSLRFVVGAGGVVFAKHVLHPGTAPNPFADKATAEIVSLSHEAVTEAVSQAVRT